MASCTVTTYQFDYQKETEVLYSFVTTNDGNQSYNCTNKTGTTTTIAIENTVNANITIPFNTTTSAINYTAMDLCSGGVTESFYQTLNTDVSSNNNISYTVVTPATDTSPGTYDIEITITPNVTGDTSKVISGIFTYTPTYESGTTTVNGAFVTWYGPYITQTFGTCTIDISGNTYSMNLGPPEGSTCVPVSYIITVAGDTISIAYQGVSVIPANPNYYPQSALLYLGLMSTLATVIDGVSGINQQTFNVGLMCLMPAVFNVPVAYNECGV